MGLLQWGHGEFAVDDCTGLTGVAAGTPSFNGATANSPWMTTIENNFDKLLIPASMGPRRIRRG